MRALLDIQKICKVLTFAISSMVIITAWAQMPPPSSSSFVSSDIWRVYKQKGDPQNNTKKLSDQVSENIAHQDTLMASINRDLPLLHTHIDTLQISGSLPLMMRFTLKSSRWYWWDKDWLSVVLPLHLTYNPLTERYQLTRLQKKYYYQTLDELQKKVLLFVWPVFPLKIVPDGKYYAELTLSIDHQSLPLPLQVEAATNNDWQWRLKFPPITLHLP